MRIPFLAWPAAIVWALLWFVVPPEPYRPAETPEWVVAVREAFAARAHHFGGDGADLLPGLVLGDTSAVSESLTGAMRVSSLSHLTAVSGANCAVIVSVVFGLCALAGLRLWWRIGVSAVALGLFVVLVGAEPSVIRAAIMACIALLALGLGRPTAGLTVLSAAVLVSLAVAPSLSHSIGFALSVAATAGLLVLAGPLRDLLARRIPSRLALVVAVPVSAQIAVQPLLLLFAPAIPTYGVLANALADPLAPVATVAGLIALILGGVPWVATPILWLAWACSALIAGIARITSSLTLASLPWPAGWVGIVIATVISVGACWAILSRHLIVGAVSVTLALGTLSSTLGGSVVAWSNAPDDWSVAQCDVGQGDAVVIRDQGRVALIDTGRETTPIHTCLSQLGIRRIDLLVLTHFDIDHAGGYESVVGMTSTVLHGPTDGIADEVILRTLGDGGAQLVPATRGLRGQLGRLDWSVLWPIANAGTEPGNPSSVVVRFEPGERCDSSCLSLLDLGDLPAQQQSTMVGLGGIGTVSVVKVSHHGSHDQSPELYARLRAPIGLIGVGADNEYGHPTDLALQLVRSSGGTPIRSDESGIALVNRAADGTIRVWTERSG